MTHYLSLTCHGVINTTMNQDDNILIVPKRFKIISFSVPGKFSYAYREIEFIKNTIRYGKFFLDLFVKIMEIYGNTIIARMDLSDTNPHKITSTKLLNESRLMPILNQYDIFLRTSCINAVLYTIYNNGTAQILFRDELNHNLVHNTTNRYQNMRLSLPGTYIENRLLYRNTPNEGFEGTVHFTERIYPSKLLQSRIYDVSTPLVNPILQCDSSSVCNFNVSKQLGLYKMNDISNVFPTQYMNYDRNMSPPLFSVPKKIDFSYQPDISYLLESRHSDLIIQRRSTKGTSMPSNSILRNGIYLKNLIEELERKYPGGDDIVLFLDSCRITSTAVSPSLRVGQTKEIESYINEYSRGYPQSDIGRGISPENVITYGEYAMGDMSMKSPKKINKKRNKKLNKLRK